MNFIQRIIYKLADKYLSSLDLEQIVYTRKKVSDKLQREIKCQAEKDMAKFLLTKGDGFINVIESHQHYGYLVQGAAHHKVIIPRPQPYMH